MLLPSLFISVVGSCSWKEEQHPGKYTIAVDFGRMWVNILLFVVGLVTAAYLYLTRKFGTFKAHGIWEYEPSFPFGSPHIKEMFTGKRHFSRNLEEMYSK